MQYDNPLADNEHMIKVDKTAFGYAVIHKTGSKTIFTGSYKNKSAALRTAKRLASQARQKSEIVWLRLNNTFGK